MVNETQVADDDFSDGDMATYIALIRHGDYKQKKGAPSAFQPFPLTQTGMAQAESCTQLIADFLAETNSYLAPEIHSSVMLRAWQTAKIIRDAIVERQAEQSGQYRIVETELLGERCVGSLANLTADEIEAVVDADPRYEIPLKNWKSDSHYRLPYPGAESLMDAGLRVAQYIDKVTNAYRVRYDTYPLSSAIRAKTGPRSGSLRLFIGHGAAIRHAAYHWGVLQFEDIARLSMYHASPIFLKLKNRRWQHVSGAWKKRNLNTQYTD